MADHDVKHSLELIKSSLEFKQNELAEKVRIQSLRLDELQSLRERPDRPEGRDGKHAAGVGAYVAQPGFIDAVRKIGRFGMEITDRPLLEQKALIASSDLGYSTPGVLGAQRVQGVTPLARRRLTVRDMLRSAPMSASMADFIRETSFTNSASPQGGDGVSKAESSMQFEISSARAATVAHWIPVSRQALDDLPELGRFIDANLLWGLKLKEETEILVGDGLGDHLNGLVTQATAYTGAYGVGSDTKLDVIAHAILELADAEESANFCILNPRDFHDISLIKTEEGGANRGSYVAADPLGGLLQVRTLWGLSCVITRTMPVGRFLVGDASQAEIRDRMRATVDISTEHSDVFTKNKVAIRAEERVALLVFRPSGFVYGAF
ncbi:MAG: phage major capsid protein [Bryobacterales bacterium]|nr:phage major capsid protein [Bryobacterales bacterium]